MNWDISLAVFGFLVQCTIALLGLKLLHWKHKMLFTSLVIVGAVFTGISVKRGIDASNRVNSTLAKIQQSSSKSEQGISDLSHQLTPLLGSPHLVKIEAVHAGNFRITHRLGCHPSNVAVQMTSLGLITLQSPKAYDETSVYLTASDSKLTADLLIWCK